METKKYENVNLESSRTLFRQMGMILALGIIFITFEYSQTDINASEIVRGEEIVLEEEFVPITRVQEPPPPPPPPPPAFTEVLTIVDDDVDLDEELELDDMEINEDVEIDILEYEEEEENDDNAIFQRVEQMPEFPGGYAALMQYLSKNLHYPEVAEENGIQGRVFIKFTVRKNGAIGDVMVLKGVDRAIDAEAVRVVQSMPHWAAGKQRNQAVNVSCNLPIAFTLQ